MMTTGREPALQRKETTRIYTNAPALGGEKRIAVFCMHCHRAFPIDTNKGYWFNVAEQKEYGKRPEIIDNTVRFVCLECEYNSYSGEESHGDYCPHCGGSRDPEFDDFDMCDCGYGVTWG